MGGKQASFTPALKATPRGLQVFDTKKRIAVLSIFCFQFEPLSFVVCLKALLAPPPYEKGYTIDALYIVVDGRVGNLGNQPGVYHHLTPSYHPLNPDFHP